MTGSRHSRPARSSLATLALILGLTAAAVLFGRLYVVHVRIVQGDSMAPLLRPGDRVIVLPWYYRWNSLDRGDLVAIDLPADPGLTVKRVIALPLDTIRVYSNRMFVADRPLHEPYLAAAVDTLPILLSTQRYQVAEGSYFVMGDNRGASIDSRFFGAVKRERIVGRVFPWP